MSSSQSPTPIGKRQRVRTESQLTRKRLVDRKKQRENRQERKDRLSSIENDIADIKSALMRLTLTPRIEPPSTPTRYSLCSAPQLEATKISHPSAPFWSSRLVHCQCGLQHVDRFDCIDACSMTTVYQQNMPTGSSYGPYTIPRNPSFSSIMLQRMDENLATFLITGCLRQYKLKSIEQLLGLYLLGYRYMRWKMFPSVETLQDVPCWMWPTETQLAHPHNVVVDFLPWPRLRDFLCTSQDLDPGHSLGCYLESIDFAWPSNVQMFAQSSGGQIELSHGLEVAMSDLNNWRLGSPWVDTFPHLSHLVTTTEQG